MPQIFIGKRRASANGQEPPSLIDQIKSLAKAIKNWTLAGFPTRTDEQVDAVLAICQECDQFKDGRCLFCGCALVRKIKMATESCPLPEPKWLAEVAAPPAEKEGEP